MRVLIIDDEEDIRAVARLSLTAVGGMDVIEASNGFLGIEKAAREQPDVILLDLMMPGLDGSATLERLKSSPETSEIPVVFLTAKAMAEEVLQLDNARARGVITKPFNPMKLAAELRRVLASG